MLRLQPSQDIRMKMDWPVVDHHVNLLLARMDGPKVSIKAGQTAWTNFAALAVEGLARKNVFLK
jgi:hypothetical protein